MSSPYKRIQIIINPAADHSQSIIQCAGGGCALDQDKCAVIAMVALTEWVFKPASVPRVSIFKNGIQF